jgi:hypothetical protein
MASRRGVRTAPLGSGEAGELLEALGSGEDGELLEALGSSEGVGGPAAQVEYGGRLRSEAPGVGDNGGRGRSEK